MQFVSQFNCLELCTNFEMRKCNNMPPYHASSLATFLLRPVVPATIPGTLQHISLEKLHQPIKTRNLPASFMIAK